MRQKSLRLSLAEEPRVNVADEEDVVADTQETMMVCVETSVFMLSCRLWARLFTGVNWGRL
jgi:hypothetical protein